MGNSKKKALFSVTPFEGLCELVQRLVLMEWEIIATKDACEVIRESGIKVTNVAEFNGVPKLYDFPPTLHPKMEYALTVDCPERIDIVLDIPYGLDDGNDVGGYTLLALAAKGNRIPIMSVKDMDDVITLFQTEGGVGESYKKELINKVYLKIARHYFELIKREGGGKYLGCILKQELQLESGENPYQRPAYLYSCDDADQLSLPSFKQISGNSPCYTNLADMDCILETIVRLSVACENNLGKIPFVTIAAKHGNPCGLGVSFTLPEESIDLALLGNPRAIWGGEVIVNFPIEGPLADKLLRSKQRGSLLNNEYWMLDIILAPSIDKASVEVLSKNANRKLLVNPFLSLVTLRSEPEMRFVRGGALVQPTANYVIELQSLCWSSNSVPSENKLDLLIAWATVFTSNLGGNEIAIVKNGQLLSIDGGASTVDAARQAIMKAQFLNHDCKGGAFAADAFFPFTDAPEILCDSGVLIGVVPKGGTQYVDVRKYFISRKVNVGFLAEEFRGFCRH